LSQPSSLRSATLNLCSGQVNFVRLWAKVNFDSWGWLFGLGETVKILPEKNGEQYHNYLKIVSGWMNVYHLLLCFSHLYLLMSELLSDANFNLLSLSCSNAGF